MSSASWRLEHIRARLATGEESSRNEALVLGLGRAKKATPLYSDGDDKLGGSETSRLPKRNDASAKDLHVIMLFEVWLIV
jgi:hypothetical protein